MDNIAEIILKFVFFMISTILVFCISTLALVGTNSLTSENLSKDNKYDRKSYTGLYVSSWFIIILKSIISMMIIVFIIMSTIIIIVFFKNLAKNNPDGLLGEEALAIIKTHLIPITFGASTSKINMLFIFVLVPILLVSVFATISTINKNFPDVDETKLSYIKDHMHNISFFIIFILVISIQIYIVKKNIMGYLKPALKP